MTRLRRWASAAVFVVAVGAVTATSPPADPSTESAPVSGVVQLSATQRTARVRLATSLGADAGRAGMQTTQLGFPVAASASGLGEALVVVEQGQSSFGAATDRDRGWQDAAVVGGEHGATRLSSREASPCAAEQCDLTVTVRFVLLGEHPVSVAWTAESHVQLRGDKDPAGDATTTVAGPSYEPADFSVIRGAWQAGPSDPQDVQVAEVDVVLPTADSEAQLVPPEGVTAEVHLTRSESDVVDTGEPGSGSGTSTAQPHPRNRTDAERPDEAAYSTTTGDRAVSPLDARAQCAGRFPCRLSGWVVVRPSLRATWWRIDVRTPRGTRAPTPRVRSAAPAVARGQATLTDAAPESPQSIAVTGAVSGTTLLAFVDATVVAQRDAPRHIGGVRARLTGPAGSVSDEGVYVANGAPGRPASAGHSIHLGRCGDDCDELPLTFSWVNPGRTGEIDLEWRVLVVAVRTDGRPSVPIQISVR